jgi:uncharacterized protein (TIGR03790 family)
VGGIRLYKLLRGTETGFRIPPEKLVGEVKRPGRTFEVRDLSNGEVYTFRMSAFGSDNTEFWSAGVIGLPGTSAGGSPGAPKHFYGAAGDGRVAVFWERNAEADLGGYGVYRKGPSDNEFRQVSRVTKIARIPVGKPGGEEGRKDPTFALGPPLFIDTDLENGKRYEYRVRAYDSRGNAGEYSRVVALNPVPRVPNSPGDVLILANADVKDSVDVAEYYAGKRNVPRGNILKLPLGKDIFEFRKFDYARDLQAPLKRFLLEKNLAGKIRYIVPCFGVPIRGAGRAVDSKLADPFDRYTWGSVMGTPNPYFNSGKHFDATYGVYLVTRIDGPTAEMAKGLVDKALRAGVSVRAVSGRAYLATKESWGNDPLVATRKAAESLGIPVVYREGLFEENELPDDALWYFAWRHPYKDPKQGAWPVGAVGAHLISDSFFKMRDNYRGKYKSWVQGMVEKGITGTFGAVIEPYYQGYTRPDIFFGHFWTGEYDFAESFFMATPTVQWAMSAVGDPLYKLAPLPQ